MYRVIDFHNQADCLVFDIRSVTIRLWKNPRKWFTFRFNSFRWWKFGAISFALHPIAGSNTACSGQKRADSSPENQPSK
jgi:hypothetical protein